MTQTDLTTLEHVQAAFAPYRAAMKEALTLHLRRQVGELLTRLDGQLNRIYDREVVVSRPLAMQARELCELVPGQAPQVTFTVAENRTRLYQLSEAKLAKEVDHMTDTVFAKWELKMAWKLLGLTQVTVDFYGMGSMTIHGRLGTRKVRVQQDTIVKRSKHGQIYFQWPARIYVDGKFTPEAAYKALCA